MHPDRPNLHQGAATDGDTMLAMCDLNGNGVIDIEEVFGDRTLDPMTKKPLRAPNGFEALKAVAKSIQKANLNLKIVTVNATGTQFVFLKELKRGMQAIGCDLGFIHDHNVVQLEPLDGVFAVDVTNYRETPDDVRNGMRFAEKGTFLDEQNVSWEVDDVWFTGRRKS
jgi:hypothetical protein